MHAGITRGHVLLKGHVIKSVSKCLTPKHVLAYFCALFTVLLLIHTGTKYYKVIICNAFTNVLMNTPKKSSGSSVLLMTFYLSHLGPSVYITRIMRHLASSAKAVSPFGERIIFSHNVRNCCEREIIFILVKV